MKIPMLNLTAQNLPIEAELKEAFANILHSGRFILGPEVDQFEEKIAAMAGAKHAIGVSSGTDALLLALMTLEIGPGDEVLCPAFTFFATAGSIARLGARPVFVDSLEETFNIDPADAVKKITDRTRAIIPVHLYGEMADMKALREIAKRHDLALIEDAAQALGASSEKFEGKAGAIGDFGAFSFFPSKNLGCLGDGGLLITSDEELANRARILRVHGMEPKYFHPYVGANFRMDPLQAAFLRVKLPHYENYTEKRRKNAEFYLERLAELPGVFSDPETAPEKNAVLLPKSNPGHIWNQFTLRIRGDRPTSERRDEFRNFLSGRGIGNEIYYPKPLHTQECFSETGQSEESLPQAEALARESISIPVFPELSDSQKEKVVEVISEFLRK